MITITTDANDIAKIHVEGDSDNLMAELLAAISGIYKGLKNTDLDAAFAFRAGITNAVNDCAGPLWNEKEVSGNDYRN